MNIFAILTIPHDGHPVFHGRGCATINVIEALEQCDLFFRGVSFKPGKMLVEVLLEVDAAHGPRNETEASDDVRIELDKAGLDASILIVHGTEYASEEPPESPPMTLQSQLRHGEV